MPALTDGPAAPGEDPDHRLICSVLAAQIDALLDGMDIGTMELLWQTSDVLTAVRQVVTDQPPADPTAAAWTIQLAGAADRLTDLAFRLEEQAFLVAQRQDYVRQSGDCLAAALRRLAEADAPDRARLSAGGLLALYVTEEQRQVHEAAAQAFCDANADSRRPHPARHAGTGGE